MTVVDASVWVATLVEGDEHHGPSRAWIAERLSEGEPLVVPEFALPEVAGAVARRTGSSTLGVRAARRVLATPRLALVEADAATWQLATMLAAAHGLRGADALYVAVARQLGAIFVTWDTEMLGRAQRQVAIVSPRAPG